jgi:hypothetical protein
MACRGTEARRSPEFVVRIFCPGTRFDEAEDAGREDGVEVRLGLLDQDERLGAALDGRAVLRVEDRPEEHEEGEALHAAPLAGLGAERVARPEDDGGLGEDLRRAARGAGRKLQALAPARGEGAGGLGRLAQLVGMGAPGAGELPVGRLDGPAQLARHLALDGLVRAARRRLRSRRDRRGLGVRRPRGPPEADAQDGVPPPERLEGARVAGVELAALAVEEAGDRGGGGAVGSPRRGDLGDDGAARLLAEREPQRDRLDGGGSGAAREVEVERPEGGERRAVGEGELEGVEDARLSAGVLADERRRLVQLQRHAPDPPEPLDLDAAERHSESSLRSSVEPLASAKPPRSLRLALPRPAPRGHFPLAERRSAKGEPEPERPPGS